MKQAAKTGIRSLTASKYFLRTAGYVRMVAVLALIGGPALAGDALTPAPSPHSASAPQTPPSWRTLTPAQQQALAPLAGEWDTLDNVRKEKWLAIGNRFTAMKPEEQQRTQEKMRDWVKLTPEQRKIVRENYARSKKITPDQKSAQWQQYQQLSDEQKQKLAASAPQKKAVANLPAHASVKTIPPIKTARKPTATPRMPNAAQKTEAETSPATKAPEPKKQENP